MAKSGPKARTTKNSPTRTSAPQGLWDGFAPPADFEGATSAEFNRLVANLRRIGTLDRTDPRLVCLAAELHGMIEQARAEMKGSPLTLTSPNGASQQHPMAKLVIVLSTRLRESLNELGLSSKGSKQADAKPATSSATPSKWAGLLNVTG